MKVILVNGSPHSKGCTFTALREVADTIENAGIETELFWIGGKPLSGCIDCRKCVERGVCVFDDRVNEFLGIAANYDGYVFGSPVHWHHGQSGSDAQILFSHANAHRHGPLLERGTRHKSRGSARGQGRNAEHAVSWSEHGLAARLS